MSTVLKFARSDQGTKLDMAVSCSCLAKMSRPFSRLKSTSTQKCTPKQTLLSPPTQGRLAENPVARQHVMKQFEQWMDKNGKMKQLRELEAFMASGGGGGGGGNAEPVSGTN